MSFDRKTMDRLAKLAAQGELSCRWCSRSMDEVRLRLVDEHRWICDDCDQIVDAPFPEGASSVMYAGSSQNYSDDDVELLPEKAKK